MKIINENITALMQTKFNERAMDHYNTILEYPDMLERMEKKSELIRFTKEGEDFRDAMEALDHARRHKHDAAMVSLNVLNRMCAQCDLPAVTDPEDFSDIHRTEVGDAICEHVKEVLDADRKREHVKAHEKTHMTPPAKEIAPDEPIAKEDDDEFDLC